MGTAAGHRLALLWAGLPLVLEGEPVQVLELASALDADEVPAQLSHVPPRDLSARQLLQLHRAWRQIMLLAYVDFPRVQALARALLEGSLPEYLARYLDGAAYLAEPLAMSEEEALSWLQPEL